MKIQMKIIATLSLLWILVLFRLPLITEAAYDYTNQSCGLDHGRDIVFVIQDTLEMQRQDPTQDRIQEVSRLIDQANTKDRFGVIGFHTEITKQLAMTSNKWQAKESVQSLASHSNVNGNDASTGFEKAIQELSKGQSNNDKIIVLMTIGTSVNNEKIQVLANEAYEKNIQVHTISFGDKSHVDVPTLKNIAETTGGNYHHSPNAAYLQDVLSKLHLQIVNFSGREVHSDWKLTDNIHETKNLLIHENVKIDLNGYDLTVDGDIVMLPCSEIRAVHSSVITAKNVDQKSRSSIRLSNSQLHVTNSLKQDGLLAVNGDYKGSAVPEVRTKEYNQRTHGYLDLNGQTAEASSAFIQEGRVDLNGGVLHAKSHLHQKGHFNVQKGKLQVDGNLTINGGPLIDDAFLENKSLNVGEGLLQVGSAASMSETRATGNVKQLSGQLFVNHGTVNIYGDYSITDGWLTMVKGSMDTATPEYGEGDGDYVHVRGNFSTASKRNHGTRNYTHLSKPMHDQGHLTDGVLKIDGSFTQSGNKEEHPIYTDRYQQFEKDYSRYNFHAEGRHKVVLTGKQEIKVAGTGFTFNLLELHGKLSDYRIAGPVNWNRLNEVDKSANANLVSLSVNDISVRGFTPSVMRYFGHQVPADSFIQGAQTLKVDARPEDRNAQVDVLNRTVASDGTAEVKVLVTAADGKTQSVYTVYVTVGPGSSGKVTSIKLDRSEILFNENGAGGYLPAQVSVGYTVFPTNAVNQQVNWSSTDPAVAVVSPNGVVTPVKPGEATIVATTADGGFIDSAAVKVLKQIDLLEGIHSLADFVSDNDRYDQIMGGLYDLEKIGFVVPGAYIDSITFSTSGNLTIGTVNTKAASVVDRVEVRVNGKVLGANKNGNTYIFTRAAMNTTDYIEVIAFDSTSNELERAATTYPVAFQSANSVGAGFYSVQRLIGDPILFNHILADFSPEQLRFIAK